MIEIPGYRVVRPLGRGGMASVYLAIQESVDREVALKVMSPHLLADPNFGERFLREARIAAKLQHRHVVGVHDVGRHNDLHYIAMEYLEGGPIQTKEGGARDAAFALRVTREIASALGYAHSKGFVHRDVKPDNILLRDDQTSALTDFGIARASDSATRMTRTGAVIGTPHYMSPEQARGRQIDGRADLYSLGIVLYELLLGRVPFSADDSLAVGIMHITEPVPRLPPPFEDLQPLLDRMLAKLPEERFQSGDECADAIRDVEIAIAHGELPHLFNPTAEQSRRILERLPGGGRLQAPRSDSITSSTPTRGATTQAIGSVGSSTRSTPRATTSAEALPRGRAEPSIGPIDFDGTTDTGRRRNVADVPKRRGLGWIVALLAVVAIGVAAWFNQDRLRALIPETEQNSQLADADAALAAGDLVGTNGASAREKYAAILRVDPDNAKAAAGMRQVGERLVEQSRAALAAGDLPKARSLAQSAREIIGGGEAVDSLDAEIRSTEGRSVEIDALLEKAMAARAAGQLVEGEGNALAYYQQALDVDAANAIAARGIQEILQALSTQAQEKIAAGDAPAAQTLADQIARISPNHASLPELRAALADAGQRAAEAESAKAAQQAEEAIARGEQQLRSGALLAPPGDNALESFRAALTLKPDDARARAGLNKIGASLLVQAEAAIDASDAAAAAKLVKRAESIGAPRADLAATKSRLRELNERTEIAKETVVAPEQAQRVEALLAEAEAAASVGNFIYPPGDSAYDKFRAALAIDRQNAAAKAGIAALPAKAKSMFAGALVQGRNNTARSYVDAVETIRADDPDLPNLRTQLAQSWLKQAERQIDEAQLDAADKSIAKARELAPAIPEIADVQAKLAAARGG